MPPKIRELIAQLERNGFSNRGSKGSHRVYGHPLCSKIVTVLGKDGNDAKRYQIKEAKTAILKSKEN